MSNLPKQSRTEATEERYINRCEQLLRRYWRETGVDFEFIHPIEFIDWLIEVMRGLKPRSFRHYKASVMFALPLADICTLWMDQALDGLALTSESICDYKGPPRTSSAKRKKYPPEFLDKMIDEVVKNTFEYKYGQELLLILIGTIALGLRPCEWRCAEIEVNDNTSNLVLHVQNAKVNNVRSFGPEREIEFGFLPKEVQAAIKHLVNLATECTNWSKEYARIADLHYRLQRKLRPRAKGRYAIYSARHQYIANLKLAGVFDHIALLVGHGSRRTAAEHYGRKSAGRKVISSKIDWELTKASLPRPSQKMFNEHTIKDDPRLSYRERVGADIDKKFSS